jgi:hypothetical protein
LCDNDGVEEFGQMTPYMHKGECERSVSRRPRATILSVNQKRNFTARPVRDFTAALLDRYADDISYRLPRGAPELHPIVRQPE